MFVLGGYGETTIDGGFIDTFKVGLQNLDHPRNDGTVIVDIYSASDLISAGINVHLYAEENITGTFMCIAEQI